MAAKKFETIEEVASEMGVEINEQTKPFLMKFVVKKKGEPGEASEGTTSNRRKELLAEAKEFGIDIAEPAAETVDSLKLRIIGHLYSEGMETELEKFCAENKLAIDEDGKVYRVKSAVKPIEERKAGEKEGTIGALSIKLLQDERYAHMSVTELVDVFPEFCEEQGYPEQGAKGTTNASLQWYVNYCRKHFISIVERARTPKAKAVEGGKRLGAELTMEKALAPKGFARKKASDAAPMDLED